MKTKPNGITAAAELAAIRERAERATPGPWSARRWAIPTADQFFVMQAFEGGKEIATAWQGVRYPNMPRISGQEASDNAEFIAHAREDIPKLLAEIERLQDDLRVVRSIANDFDYMSILEYLDGGDAE